MKMITGFVRYRSSAVRSVVCLVLLAAGTISRADDLYDLYQNSHSHQPFVAFMARKSGATITKPGHAVVALGTELDNRLLFYEAIFGYYPKDETAAGEVKAVWTAGPGSLTFKFKDLSWDIQFRRNVTDAQKAAAMKVVERWQSNDPKYNLFASGGRNCSSFVSEIATAIGLKAPDNPGGQLPIDYIAALKKLNGS